MSLRVEGRALGQTYFRVEEYKRPKFQVTLDVPKTSAKLNEKVSLVGHAMGYTGAAVGGAQVKYRVVREVRMPWWWGWWRGDAPGGESQEIVHGIARTETDGSFKVEFTAAPDRKVPEKDEPMFAFQIHTDVTDSTGETRSADRSIRVGYTALETTMTAEVWQTQDQPTEIKLATKTLDDEPQVAEGNVKVCELQAPERAQRAPMAGAQYWRYSHPSESSGPSDADRDLSNPNNWPLGKVVAEKGFTTDTNGVATLSFKLAAGAYRAVLETQDRFGKKVTGKLPLQGLKLEAAKLAIRVPHLLTARNWELQPGEEFVALWGTSYDVGRAFIEIEQRHQMLQRFWTKPGQTQQQIKLAVTEALRGGFTVHVMQVRENRSYLESRRVSVPWKNEDLELKWEHFASELQPGQKETWTLQIQGPKSMTHGLEREVAEVVATLYDESLDAFASPNWLQRFNIFREDYSAVQT